MSLRIRSLLGIVLATIAAILFLKFADSQSPFAEPSHLYQERNHFLGLGLPWWIGAGVIIGLVIGVSLLRSERQLQQGFVNIPAVTVLVAFILSYFAFAGYTITLPNYLLVSVINALLFTIITVLPAAVALVIISMLSSRPAKRSAWEVMPAELKAEMQRKSAPSRRFALPAWLTHHNQQEH